MSFIIALINLMSIEYDIMLYCLAKTFSDTLGVDICDDSKSYIKTTTKKFQSMDKDDRIYYQKYSILISKAMTDYLDDITLFELNVDPDNKINHDFRLSWKGDNVAHISLYHTSIVINDVIPKNLMKICGYKKNTNIYKSYVPAYEKINDNGYKKIKSNQKYSDLKDKEKNKIILDPIRELVIETISKKRKCAKKFHDHLFADEDRIVFRLHRNRFVMYDFGKEQDAVESFTMKEDKDRDVTIVFNNKSKFVLTLQTNASDIKPQLSTKFKTVFKNIDEIYMVDSGVI